MTPRRADGAPESSSSSSPAASPVSEDTHRMRLRSPADLVVAAPYLLGFRPERSLVVIAIGGPSGREVRVTMRVDLAPPERPGAAPTAPVAPMLEAVLQAGGDSVLLLAYPGGRYPSTPDRPALPSRALVEHVARRFTEAGIEVLEALCVLPIDGRNYRYWSYLCEDPRCCSPQGGVTDDLSATGVRAGFVGAGLAPLSGRDELVALLAPAPAEDPSVAALRAAVDARRDVICSSTRRWAPETASRLDVALRTAAAEGPKGELDVDVQALLVVSLSTDLHVRDLLLAAAARELRLDHLVDVLVPLVRRSPPAEVAAVAATLAGAAYLEGHGALAWVAVDRALACDPTQSLAMLVAGCLTHGLPPHDLREAITSLPERARWDGSILAVGRPGPGRASARARRR